MGRLAQQVTTKQTVKTELKLKPSVQRRLLNELRSYAGVAAEAKALKAAGDGHRATILGMQDEIGEKKFEIDGFKVALTTDAEDRRLDKDKLVKRLIRDGHYSLKSAQALLEDCTTRKPKKPYATIRVPGEQDDED